jgi:hypothetical protein
MKRIVISVLAFVALTTPALCFGIGIGTPLEERVGGDYGPEYYRNLQTSRSGADHGRSPTRCRSRWTETRHGLRRVRRCH